jgi:glycosyl-4,4'-diaponeurosporenoate acyltransferase
MTFPLIPVPYWLMLSLNIVLWPFFHILISKITLKMKDESFSKDAGIYKARRFEQDGRFYEKVLLIKKWKKIIPDGATIFNEGFKKKSLTGTSIEYIQTFINETRRAELSHLLQIIPCIVFFIFNRFEIAMIMVAYALIFNVPLIWLQRYNRMRFQKLLTRLK